MVKSGSKYKAYALTGDSIEISINDLYSISESTNTYYYFIFRVGLVTASADSAASSRVWENIYIKLYKDANNKYTIENVTDKVLNS